jgi:putative hydrolase of HD superfamily
VEGIGDIIKDYEKEEMERRIYKILPLSWHRQIKTYTEEEFSQLKTGQGIIIRDGELVKANDELAAFIEVYLSLQNGVVNRDLKKAKEDIFTRYQSKVVSGINFESIYKDFRH